MSVSLPGWTKRNAFLLLALLVACLAAFPLLSEPGLLNTRGGGDSPFLLQRVQQLETAVRDGHFPVRWMPDANYGYGYPFFNFYAPLSIYIAAFFRLFGFSIVRAIHLAQLAGFLVAAWGMFQLAHRWWQSKPAALIASVAYTVAPFHMVNIYVRGDSLAEFWAMACYPLILLAVDHLFDNSDQPRAQRVALLGLAYAALIISHNISALIFSPFLLLYILLRTFFAQSAPANQHRFHTFVLALSALLLAFALAAWFFVPALAEQGLVQLGPVTEGYFHYSNHFRGLDLVQTSWLFDYGVSGGRAFRIGLVQAITAVLGLILLLLSLSGWTIRQKVAAYFTLISLLVATFMITPASQLLWDHLPLLPLTQFPWRFLSVQAFAAALAVAGLARLPRPHITTPVISIVLIVASLAALDTDHLHLTDADITAEDLAQYEWFTGNIGTTVSAEYLPAAVQPRPYTSHWLLNGERDQATILEGDVSEISLQERKTAQQTWRVTTADSAQIIFPTLFWPGWEAMVGGRQVAIDPVPGTNLISVGVPAGTHNVVLTLTRTPARLLAELVSLTAVLLTIILLLPPSGQKRNQHARKRLFYLLIVATILIGLWLLAQIENQTPLPEHDLTWDFAQMGYLHHDRGGVFFDNGAHLQQYRYSADQIMAGDTWRATVDITIPESEQLTLHLLSPAHLWPVIQNRAAPAPFATDTQMASSGHNSLQIQLPANLPAGLYIPQLTLENGRPLLPSGKTRGSLLLRPFRITAPPFSQTADLDVAAVAGAVTDDKLEVQLQWETKRPLTSNYNTSLRLLDANGQEIAALDTQPGYGFLPSSLWSTDTLSNDWLTLPLAQPLTDAAPHALVTRLYDVVTGEVILARRIGEITADNQFLVHAPQFDEPSVGKTETAVFEAQATPIIQLYSYQLEEKGGQLGVTLIWEALAPTGNNYTRFVHLLDASGQLLGQNDGFPLANSYPTSQWKTGEFIVEKVWIDSTAVSSTDTMLAVGFYLNDGVAFPRLTAVSPSGSPFPNNAVPLD